MTWDRIMREEDGVELAIVEEADCRAAVPVGEEVVTLHIRHLMEEMLKALLPYMEMLSEGKAVVERGRLLIEAEEEQGGAAFLAGMNRLLKSQGEVV